MIRVTPILLVDRFDWINTKFYWKIFLGLYSRFTGTMTDRTIQVLKAEALELGLEGKDIATYCLEQQRLARDERAAEREMKLETTRLAAQDRERSLEQALKKLEQEERQKRAEQEERERIADQEERSRQAEAAERARIAESEERARIAEAEAAERAAIRSFELEKLRLEGQRRAEELEAERSASLSVQGTSNLAMGDLSSRPKLPVLRDGEDISSFLVRFERIADLLMVQRDTFCVRLGSALSGKALDIYASLPPETTADYDRL